MNEENAHSYVQIRLAVSLTSYKNIIHIFLVTYSLFEYLCFERQLDVRAEAELNDGTKH